MNREEFHLFDRLFLRMMFGVRAYFPTGLLSPDCIQANHVSFASPFPGRGQGEGFPQELKGPIPHLHPLPFAKGRGDPSTLSSNASFRGHSAAHS
jgi:hypothetical protein